LQDAIVRDPKGAGKRFTDFLKNGCHFVFGDPKSIQAVPFDPVNFLGKDWGIEEQDKRSLVLSEIDLVSCLFETCLEKGESSITGKEKLRRLKAKKNFIRLDARFFLALWRDYEVNKENCVLEMLYRTRGIKYLDFFGTILRHPNGDRDVLYFCRDDVGQWDWYYHWLDIDWNAGHFSFGCAS
jgi:hypothetical protein